MASGDGQPRTYSIASDTSAGDVAPNLLSQEIADDTGITTALDYINTAGDVLDIYFVATLSAGEITALDTLVGAHVATATTRNYQFWESNTATTTTSETFVEKMARTSAAMQAGPYRLSWSFELKVTPVGPLNSRAIARFLVDGNVKNIVCEGKDLYTAYSGWDRYVAVEGETPELSLEIRRDPTLGGNDTIEIRKMKLGIEFTG